MENSNDAVTSYSHISILDIFGFENFENNNSFEQLCINYANEKLQHYFNDHVINMELEEYKNEGINIEKINYEDNKEIIEFFDGNTETINKKKISMFSLLESEDLIKMEPSKADKRFRNYVYQQLLKPYPNVLIEDKYNKSENKENFIIINHYAGKIVYNVIDMVQKNLSQLNNDIKETLTNSSNGLIKKIFAELSKDNKNKQMDKILSDTLIRQFKKQIQELFRKIQDSNKIYVKCINPNDKKMPKNYDRNIISEQMKYLGILELIKIKQKGYNIHISKEDFQNEYKYLINGIKFKLNTTKTLENVIEYIKELDEDNNPCKTSKIDLILVGKINTIFMKEDFKQYLDYLLSKEQKKMIKIQAHVRGRIERNKLYRLTTSVVKIQYSFRKMIKRVRNKNATKIQSHFRGLVERKKLKEIIKKIIRIQTNLRSLVKRKKLKEMIKKSIKIQANLRSLIKRKKLKEMIKKTIRIQAHFRSLVERKKLKEIIKKVTRIQAHIRCIIEKKKLYKLRQIIKIQKCIRGKKQRNNLRSLKKKQLKFNHI
jgi:myosin heavy subunit